MLLPLTFIVTRAAAVMASDTVAGAISWVARFATRFVARRLDVPEIVVHGICLYVAAYIGEVERNASLVCPLRVFHDLRRHRLPRKASSSSRASA
jgi:hypothetical protein